MIKRKIIAGAFLIFGFGSAIAQITPNDFMSQQGMILFTKKKTPDTFTGSPYVEKDFIQATVSDDKGRKQKLLVKYNALEDVVLVKANATDTESYVLPKLRSIEYSLSGYTYVIDGIDTEDGYLESYLLEYYDDGNIRFVGYPNVKSTPGRESTGYQSAKPASIDVTIDHYISVDGKEFQYIKLKEKHLEKIFDNDTAEDYLDENKIKDEQDVVNFLKFYSKSI